MTFTEYEDIVEGIDIKAYRNAQKALKAKKEKSSTKNKLLLYNSKIAYFLSLKTILVLSFFK